MVCDFAAGRISAAPAHIGSMNVLISQCISVPSSPLLSPQSELEDLCFAVLQPAEFQQLRHDLDVLWGCTPKMARPPPTSSSGGGSGGVSAISGGGSRAGRQVERSGSGSAAVSRDTGVGAPADVAISLLTAADAASIGRGGATAPGGSRAVAPRRLLGPAVAKQRSSWVRLLAVCLGWARQGHDMRLSPVFPCTAATLLFVK